MKITTIHNIELGTVKASRKNLDEVRAEYEQEGYKVVNGLNTHIENDKYVLGGYDLHTEADMIFAASNIRIVEQEI